MREKRRVVEPARAAAQSVVLTEQMAAPLQEVPAGPQACFPARPGRRRTRKRKEMEDISGRAKKKKKISLSLTSTPAHFHHQSSPYLRPLPVTCEELSSCVVQP